jgi:feruloyl esterase
MASAQDAGSLAKSDPVQAGQGAVQAGGQGGRVIADPAACMALSNSDFSRAVGDNVQMAATIVAATAQLPAICEVKARIDPSTQVLIRLPLDTPSLRLLVGGCWLLCGAIDAARTDDALARGYVTAQTDMGHQGPGVDFARDPDKLEDFSWRATHRSTVLAKAVMGRFYGGQAFRSYFRGCSTGGRQGLTEALLFPREFDGVIAGAPAIQMAAPMAVWALRANIRTNGRAILDAPAIRLLHKGAMDRCDMDDGVRDGVIAAPRQCGFRPVQLLCAMGKPEASCLSGEQVGAADKIYRGIVTGDGQPLTSMGFAPGSELGWIGAITGENGAQPGNMFVFNNYRERFSQRADVPSRLQDLDFDKFRVRTTKLEAVPSFGDAPMRLSEFGAAGGKLLLYTGWADPALPPATTLDFVAGQEAAMGGADKLTPFMRHFMLPGMGHCAGGEGPDQVDFLSVMEAWVERGEAPDQLVAYKVRTEKPAQNLKFPLPARSVILTRPVYRYPAIARWTGRGKTDGHAAFEPRMPDSESSTGDISQQK